ncbi:gastrokine-1-like [Chamaea fasciata]|uniref:gastrokine-1-like n=1 Tax=Chamaea fasciata TaxID=190680 RepID=UPI003369C968
MPVLNNFILQGVIATKVPQQNTCYISIMNRSEMPSFNNLARLAQESRNQIGFGRPTKKITFVANGLVNNLSSYGADVFSMCSGLTTYMAYEVHGLQVNLGSCITLNVLRVVDLKYCNGNGQSQQIPGGIVNNTQVIVGGQSQIVTINRQWHVAVIEKNTVSGSWKTIWNYNTGVIATKVPQQNTCYISIMNRSEMPSFNNLARLAQESRNQIGFGRPTKKITFVANGLVNNLSSYGADVFSMCSGLTTYMAYEVHGLQVNLGSCITLNVLGVVDLKYCNGNGQSQQIPGGIVNNTQVIVGGQSQIVTINRQWHVAIIEKNTVSGSWKTIWNYNTRVFSDPKA